jgi:Protein of unknown function (DUF3592)
LLVWWFGGYISEVSDSQSWVTAKATITNVSQNKVPTKGEPKYDTHYTYRFMVANEPYTSERYDFISDNNYPSWPGPYHVGESVDIYYNPKAPAQAIMRRISMKEASASLVIPIGIFAIAILVTFINRTSGLIRASTKSAARPR